MLSYTVAYLIAVGIFAPLLLTFGIWFIYMFEKDMQEGCTNGSCNINSK